MRHIEFCLEEIECEIEALDDWQMGGESRSGLAAHIAGMRAILADLAVKPAARLEVAGDDLTLVRGIGVADAAMLAGKGITRFAEISDWTRAGIDALGGGDALRQRIASENWIEQAAILATGRLTHHAEMTRAARSVEASAIAALAAAIRLPSPVDAAELATPPAVEPTAMPAEASVLPMPVHTSVPPAEASDTTPGTLPATATIISLPAPAKPRRRLATLVRVAATLLLIAGAGVFNAGQFVTAEAIASVSERLSLR